MKTLLAPTEDFIKRERGRLSADVAAGSSVNLSVDSSDGVQANDFIVIGYEGNELCELARVESVTNNTVMTATLKFAHKADEPFVIYRFDKRKFYGATSATGSFTELTGDGSPKAISVDDPQGTLLEYTASIYTYFKATYYNSVTSEETDIDESDAVLGDESLRYATIYAIRKHAGLQGNPFYSDQRLEVKRKQAENEIDSVIAARYVLPLTEIPAILGQICELLAAGYIDYEEFGKDGEGVKWLATGRSLLNDLKKGDRILIGTDGTELTRNTKVGRPSGYPDTTIEDSTTEGRKFQISDKY